MAPLALLALVLSLPAPAANVATPRRVVYIGDSHSVMGFGQGLLRRIGRPGGRVVDVYAACSGRVDWFLPGGAHSSPCGTYFRRWNGSGYTETTRAAPTPAIGSVVDGDVDLVIIALGTNHADWRRGGVEDLRRAGELARAAVSRGALCVWIGPPPIPGWYRSGTRQSALSGAAAAANYAGLNAALRAQVQGRCAYIPGTTPYRGDDGIHYDATGGDQWAGQVWRDRDMAAVMARLP